MGADFEDFLRSHAEYPKLNCLRFEKSSLKEFPRSLWNKHLVSIFGEVSNVGFDDGALHRMNEVFEKEVVNVDKPEDIKEKILEGKIATYFKEKTLLSQPFIKNEDETIEKLLEKSKEKIVEVKRFSI